MPLKLENLRPQDKWDEETTWEELGAAMDPPMPQAWIRGLKSTHPDNAKYACPTPAHFWRKNWSSSGRNDWRGMRSCLWVTLGYVTFDDPERAKAGLGLPDTDPRIDQILALMAGLDADANLNRTPTCTVTSPFDRTRTEQRLETLDYDTTQADWDIQALQEQLNSVKQWTAILEKRAERKRHRQEKAQEEQEEAVRNTEALKRVEPILHVTLMVPELMDNGMHCVAELPWSHVQAKDGKAIFEFEGVNYELRRSKQNPQNYTGHTLE